MERACRLSRRAWLYSSAMWRGRRVLKLLIAKEVAEQLQVKERTVERLGLPVVRVGAGRGVKRYRQEDIDAYINRRIQYRGERWQREKKGAGFTTGRTGKGGVIRSAYAGPVTNDTPGKHGKRRRQRSLSSKKEIASKPERAGATTDGADHGRQRTTWPTRRKMMRSRWRLDGVRWNLEQSDDSVFRRRDSDHLDHHRSSSKVGPCKRSERQETKTVGMT